MLRTIHQLAKTRALTHVYKQKAFFGGHGHEVKEYDWRDDPAVNTDIYVDPRDRGWDYQKYTFPYEGHDDWYFPTQGHADYKHDSPYVNLRPENKKFDVDFTGMRVYSLYSN